MGIGVFFIPENSTGTGIFNFDSIQHCLVESEYEYEKYESSHSSDNISARYIYYLYTNKGELG